MADVFISYKSERRAAAEHLAEILADHGYSVWWDYGLIAGRDFGAQIEKELREAKAIVVLWCSISVGSEWVREEATLAKRLNRMVPAFLERVELPLGFSLSQTLDLSEWDGSPTNHQLAPLLRDIGALVGRAPSPNHDELSRDERAWRRFGSPRLKDFALCVPIEPSDDAGIADIKASVLRPSTSGVPAASRASERLKPGTIWRDGASPFIPEMVTLPTGSFEMGSPANERGRKETEGPQRTIRIDIIAAIGRFPVTFAQWDAALAAGARLHHPKDNGWGRHKRPVIHVTHDDALSFISWLNAELGFEGHYAYRLPSEGEWEYACRAGSVRRFAFGDDISIALANYDADYSAGGGVGGGRLQTTPVDKFSPNPFGLFDMHGNVWEWCHDCWNKNYNNAPSSTRPWSSGNCDQRVIRGGSWISTSNEIRSASRRGMNSGAEANDLGFRVARTLSL